MHPFSITLAIFVAGYITARWDLVTRLYDLAIFAWNHGVVVCVDHSKSLVCSTNENRRLEPQRASQFFRFSFFSSLYLSNDLLREKQRQ